MNSRLQHILRQFFVTFSGRRQESQGKDFAMLSLQTLFRGRLWRQLGVISLALFTTVMMLLLLGAMLATDLSGVAHSWLASYPGPASLQPPANSHTATLQTGLKATFSGEAYPSPDSPALFPVYAEFQGLITGTYLVTTDSIAFDPTDPFLPGEQVESSLVPSFTVDNQPFPGYIWQFRTAAGVGSGHFIAHPSTPVIGGHVSQALDLGDLDGDRDLDLVVANYNAISDTVWLNDGQGNFTPQPTIPGLGQTDSNEPALGDLDGDGRLDLVMAYNGGLSTWFNDGSGAFSAGDVYHNSDSSQALELGDLDADGDLDVVVANLRDQAQSVWLNDGHGLLSAHLTTPTFGAGSSTDLGLGDLDGDGDLDALVANTDNMPQTVWLNDGEGVFSAHPISPTFGAGESRHLLLGDLDGDGDLDTVIINHNQFHTIWLNNGGGGFAAAGTLPYAGNDFGGGLGDLDGDGDLDIMVTSISPLPDGGAHVFLNDGSAGFHLHGALAHFSDGYNQNVGLGDVDGDGDLDAVMARGFENAQAVWLNQDPADLIVAKNASPATLAPGDRVTYTLSYMNNGPKVATGVVLTDLLPSALTNLDYEASNPGIVERPGVTFAWEIGELAPGAGGVITITGVLTGGFAAGTVIENWTTISAGPLTYNDPAGDSTLAVVTVLNLPPSASDNQYIVQEDQAKTIAAPGVLVNDTDRNGDSLTAQKVGGPSHGTLHLAADGSFTYTPTAQYNGQDSFTYRAFDGLEPSTPALVSLTILGLNDPPTITFIADQLAFGGLLNGPISFKVGDVETPAAGLVISATSSNQTVLPDGNLYLGGAGANRTITVLPSLVTPGRYADITVTVSDGELMDRSTFRVTVKANYLYLSMVTKGD